MRNIKAMFGGAFLLLALGSLFQLIVLLTNKSPDAMTGGAIAVSTLKWAFFFVIFGVAAIYCLWSAFRRPKLVTPVKPPL